LGDLDTLLVDPRAEYWGNFDASTERLVLHDQYQSMDHDLVDEAVARTYFAKGEVRFSEDVAETSSTGLAAIYRKGRVPRAPRWVDQHA
jgi:hypothetical protein